MTNKMALYRRQRWELNCRSVAFQCLQRRRAAAAATVAVYNGMSNSRPNRQIWRRPWIQNHDEQGAMNLVRELELGDEVSYRNYFRMTKNNFHFLLNLITPSIQRQDTNFHKCIPPNERLAVCLRYLATGESFQSLSYQFRLGATTVSEIVLDTCNALYKALKDEYLKMPQSSDDWEKIASDFLQKWNFPNCLGSIDGKHISLRAPVGSGSTFFNYKHFFSIVLLALVDADYKFIYIDVGCNGRVSDGGVFGGCSLKEALDKRLVNIPESGTLPDTNVKLSYHIVGDDAFPLRTDLMKPFPLRHMNPEQRIYNYRLSRARRVVENAFGILASKFRVLLQRISLEPKKAELVVMSLCVLHNFLRVNRDSAYIGSGTMDEEDADHNLIPGNWRKDTSLPSCGIPHGNHSSCSAKVKRNFLKDYLNSTEGSVSWQKDVA